MATVLREMLASRAPGVRDAYCIPGTPGQWLSLLLFIQSSKPVVFFFFFSAHPEILECTQASFIYVSFLLKLAELISLTND